MSIEASQLRLPAVATTVAAAVLVAVAPAAAKGRHHHHSKRHHSPPAVYVSPTGPATPSDKSCRHALYSSIQDAIEGIALADHSGAGVTDNLADHNVANDIVKGNLITHNKFSGNGHAGVVVHAHAPGADFGDNVISFNVIGTNNVRTDENDLKTTGSTSAASRRRRSP